jgi:hypothetical protein
LSIAEEHDEIVAIACGGTLTVPRLRQLAREIGEQSARKNRGDIAARSLPSGMP